MTATETNVDTVIYLLAVLGMIFLLVILIIRTVTFIDDFTQELRMLNSEIDRTDGSERRYWIRRRRRLWLSLIPFVKY